MRITIISIGTLLSIICAFVFAGILGAILFASILTFSIYLVRKNKEKEFPLVNIFLFIITLSALSYGLMTVGGLLGADQKIVSKLKLIEKDLADKNYEANWIIISQKRYEILNSKLSKSAKKSNHLKGIAIDIYIFDINGDGRFNDVDIAILENSNNNVEREHPELIGGFGDYFIKGAGYFTKHMIHLDTRGKKVRYKK